LPKMMVRTRVKGVGMGRTNKVEKEPDFYGMTPSTAEDGATRAALCESVLEIETEEDEEEQGAPTTPYAQETDVMHRLPFECPRVSRNTAQTFVPPIEWIHQVSVAHQRPQTKQSFAPIVTPTSNRGGRSLFHSVNHVGLSEMAANIADSHMSSNVYTQQQQGPSNSHILSGRYISTQELPMLPMTSYNTSYIPHLQPRFRENDVDDEDTALFEGLEFQVVDDDSLEQFESELISDGTESL